MFCLPGAVYWAQTLGQILHLSLIWLLENSPSFGKEEKTD